MQLLARGLVQSKMAPLSLSKCTVQQPCTTINRIQMIFHSIVVLALVYYRASHLLAHDNYVSAFSWLLITIAELCFIIKWFMGQPLKWRPVIRTVFPENLPGDFELPGIDVFICTANPKKEPIFDVMNTVISAMALDYPSEKLAIYLSDDAGALLTLYAVKEACSFAKSWIPFCRKFGIKIRCPKAFFSSLGDDDRVLRDDEFRAQETEMKLKYETLKKNVDNAREFGKMEDDIVQDRAPHVEVIHGNRMDNCKDSDFMKMPMLVYVSRERRSCHPHHYKGGALNTLLRVSGIITNGPYILVLDCDFFCNDPTSARQAMCLHLDPNLSHSLAFVQYPQLFYNASKKDIYDVQIRCAYKAMWYGMDGIRGPVLSGTGYYMKRKALYGSPNEKDKYLLSAEKNFGSSSMFIESLHSKRGQETTQKISLDTIIEEAKTLASRRFENGTNWGREIGFSYDCFLESSFTGYLLHCKGWSSAYYYPPKPSFLGCAPVDMEGFSSQLMKWVTGLLKVGLSRFSPLIYGMTRMSKLQSLCYAHLMYYPLHSVAMALHASVPALCLLTGTPIYPKVSDPWFAVFALAYVSTLFESLYKVLPDDGSIKIWWIEYRALVIMSVTAILFGGIDAIITLMGIREDKLILTNKLIDEEKLKKYEKGKFDFQGIGMLAFPLIMLSMLNIICFMVGFNRVISTMNFEEMFGEGLVSFFFVLVCFSVIKDVITMNEK